MDKPKILVVDDEPKNLQLLRQILKEDYNLVFAKTGEDALKNTVLHLPDLVLLDVMMPGIDGYGVCRQLKADEKTRDIPVIFVTAKEGVQDETEGFGVGGVDYITKPVSPPVVRARVKNHLELKQARQELVNQNKELIEASRLRKDVENMTRHDIKNPLSIILGFSQLIQTDKTLSEKTAENIEAIEIAAYRILDMINQSLDLFKMEQGTYQWLPVAVDIAQIIRKIVHESQNLAREKRVWINTLANGTPLNEGADFLVQGEELLCYSMLANLIKNALEASSPTEQITVILDEEKDTIVIRIHNCGVVPPDIRDNFFGKYITSGKNKGTGLGTYSAKLIAETQQGHINMTSSADEGTTVTVTLLKMPL